MVQCIRLHPIFNFYVCLHAFAMQISTESGKPILVWQANLIVVLSCLVSCQKSKKGTLTEYANALAHCLTCSIDAKCINMQTTCKIYIALSIRKFDSLLLHLPFTAFQLQYSRTVSSRVRIYVYAHDKSQGMNFKLLFGKVGFAKLGGMLTLPIASICELPHVCSSGENEVAKM